VDSIKDRKERN